MLTGLGALFVFGLPYLLPESLHSIARLGVFIVVFGGWSPLAALVLFFDSMLRGAILLQNRERPWRVHEVSVLATCALVVVWSIAGSSVIIFYVASGISLEEQLLEQWFLSVNSLLFLFSTGVLLLASKSLRHTASNLA